MPLSDTEKQAIREEEHFRAEVRKELAAVKAPPSAFERLSGFFETKAGFWLLTTVLAGAFATGMTSLQQYLHREEIEKRDAADRARRDADTLVKLGPMLTSENRSQTAVALVLLTGLASQNAVESTVAKQVKDLIESTLAAGQQPNASAAEQAQAAAIVEYVDRARLTAVQSAGPDAAPAKAAESNAPAAIPDAALPVRVYLHIANEADRAAAKTVGESLRKAAIIVPGIELVPATSSPAKTNIRYCEGKVAPDAPERVRELVSKDAPEAQLLVLSPRLCGRVRFNHFEVWFSRKA
jgi:hypothetical protein